MCKLSDSEEILVVLSLCVFIAYSMISAFRSWLWLRTINSMTGVNK